MKNEQLLLNGFDLRKTKPFKHCYYPCGNGYAWHCPKCGDKKLANNILTARSMVSETSKRGYCIKCKYK